MTSNQYHVIMKTWCNVLYTKEQNLQTIIDREHLLQILRRVRNCSINFSNSTIQKVTVILCVIPCRGKQSPLKQTFLNLWIMLLSITNNLRYCIVQKNIMNHNDIKNLPFKINYLYPNLININNTTLNSRLR